MRYCNILSRSYHPPNPMPDNVIRRIASSIVSALNYVHGKGWIHLDVKPDNILFDKYCNPKLVSYAFYAFYIGS